MVLEPSQLEPEVSLEVLSAQFPVLGRPWDILSFGIDPLATTLGPGIGVLPRDAPRGWMLFGQCQIYMFKSFLRRDMSMRCRGAEMPCAELG